MLKTNLLINSLDYISARFIGDSVDLIDKIQSRKDFELLVSKFNCVKAKPLKDYIYLENTDDDEVLFSMFLKNDILYFEVSFILKTQGF